MLIDILLIGGSAVAVSGALAYWGTPLGGKGGGKIKPLPSPTYHCVVDGDNWCDRDHACPLQPAKAKPKEPEFERVLCDCPEYKGTDFWNDPHRWCDTDPVTQRIWENREFKNCERTVRPKRLSALDKLEKALDRLDNIERIRKEQCKCNNSVFDYMCPVHTPNRLANYQQQGLLGGGYHNQQQSNLGSLIGQLGQIGRIV